MQSTNIKTKTKVIVLALQELINTNKVAALKSYKGKIDLDMDIDSLRKRQYAIGIDDLKAAALPNSIHTLNNKTTMTPEQFNHYAQQGYNRIPVSREVLADLDTPLSAYLKLRRWPVFLFIRIGSRR